MLKHVYACMEGAWQRKERHWQSAKGTGEGFVSWWTVLRGGFKNLLNGLYGVTRRWQRAAGLKAHGSVHVLVDRAGRGPIAAHLP